MIPTADTDAAVVRTRDRVRRPAARQRRGGREGHAGIHRQPHRHLRPDAGLQGAGGRGDYTIEEVDAITGPAIGRPKSATFRTMDIAGIDILAARGARPRNAARCRRAAAFALPPVVEHWSSAAGSAPSPGAGFYTEDATPVEILTLDPAPDGIPAAEQAAQFPSLDAARIASTTSASASRRCSKARTRSASSCAPRSAPTLRVRGARRRRDRRLDATTSTARCAGASAGSSDRSRRCARSASTRSFPHSETTPRPTHATC